MPDRFHITNATIISMDPEIGDLDQGDILISSSRIEAIGPSLQAPPGTEVIDGSGMVALPGFVETHWHLFNTILPRYPADAQMAGWIPDVVGPHFRAEDSYASARLATTMAVNGGVTTIHDWASNMSNPENGDGEVAALLDSGIRARFSYGAPNTRPGRTLEEMAQIMAPIFPVDRVMEFDQVERLRSGLQDPADGGRVSVGVAVRGPARSTPDVYRAEWAAARAAGLPISMHCAGGRSEVKIIRQATILMEEGLLGPDVMFAHGMQLTPVEIAACAEHGVNISIGPLGELRRGAGPAALADWHEAGLVVALSFDTTIEAPDMFAVMRATVIGENTRRLQPEALSDRRVLQMATIDGARLLGLESWTGSLTPGKRADIQLLRLTDPSLVPFGDLYGSIVFRGHAAGVDTVLIDGVVRKRGGRLVGVDVDAVVADAMAAHRRLQEHVA